MTGSSLHHLPTIDVSALPPSLLGSVSSSSSSSSSPGLGGDAPPFPPSLSSLQTAVSNQFSNINQGIIPVPPPTLPACVAAGTFSFYSTLALSTLFQGKILRLSTGSMAPIPTIAGIATVAVGGLAAHGTSVVVTALQRNERDRETRRREMSSSSWWRQSRPTQPQTQRSSAFVDFMAFDRASQTFQSGAQSIENDVRNFGQALRNDPAHAVRVAALALIAFKVLGGRFWSIPPSSYTNLGSFARVSHSIPAKMDYATSAQRKVIETVGRRWGCHTCGSRMVFAWAKPSVNGATSMVKFHADHMPPRSVADAMNSRWWRRLLRIQMKQRFYPQCVSCSNVQGKILSKATASMNGAAGGILNSKANGARALAASGGGSAAYNHGFRPRVYHVTGGLVAAATVADANNDEIVRNGNARRFRMIQDQIDDTIGSVVDFCCDWLDSFR